MIILHIIITGKIHAILRLSSKFSNRTAFYFWQNREKISLLIGSKTLLKYYYTKIGEFFGNGEFHFTKAKISGKLRIFQRGSLPPWRFFSTRFLNFGCKSRPEIKALLLQIMIRREGRKTKKSKLLY